MHATQILFLPKSAYHAWMKLKITITGPKVHDVGYRPYLTELAMRLVLKGFEVYNDEEDGQQAVIALVEGDEQRVTKFYSSIMIERPQLANVDNTKSEDYPGDIMPLWQYASINTSSQMNKAIPVLLEMRDDLKSTKGNTDVIPQILEEIKGLSDELQPGFAIQFQQIQADVRAIKERLGMS